MMNEADFRKAYLSEFRHCKKLALTKAEFAMIGIIKKTGFLSAPELSKSAKVSVRSASTQLKRLMDKGYLQRVNVTDPTGGRMYEYSLPRYLRGE